MNALRALLGLAALSLASIVQAQAPAPLRIEVIQNLDFGNLLVEDLGGSVALTEQNEFRSYSPTIRPSMRTSTSEARLRLVGPPKAEFVVVLDPEQPILDNGRGGRIQVATFIYAANALRGTLNHQGEAELRLGARIDLPASVAPGLYVHPQVRVRLSILGLSPATLTESFGIRCQVRPLLHLENRTPLDFGVLVPGNSEGIYRVAPDGATSSRGGVLQYRGRPVPAEFAVTGTAGTDYCLELPRVVWLKGPGRDIEVHSFEASIPLPGVVPRGGFTFRVGASVTVPPQQEPGLYQGLFRVTIHYP